MHDEDNAIGLEVSNPSGKETWHMYGDKRLLDEEDKENLAFCGQAIQMSADEIYDAWKTGNVPKVESFGVWNIAPTLESAREPQTLAPLFGFKDGPPRRANVENRRDKSFTIDYSYTRTALDCYWS